MSEMMRPDVSVCMITYDHEKYIEEALDSVVAQSFSGKIEVVIFDDASTDATVKIIRDVVKSNPQFDWKVNTNPENIGIADNFSRAILACSGRYVAILEGDDLWADPDKLQKQMAALESDTGLSMCYSSCVEINEMTGKQKVTGPEHPRTLDLEYILRNGWFIRTPTIMFRRALIHDFPSWFYRTFSTDYVLQVLLAAKGDVLRLDDVTAVYRRHAAGISAADEKKLISRHSDKIDLLETINDHFEGRYERAIRFQQRENYKALVNHSLRSGNLNSKMTRHYSWYRQSGVVKMIWDRILRRRIS